MGFPFKLKKMDMLVDGVGHLAETEEVTIPKLALKTEDWLGGGMLGPVPIDMGLDKIEFEFSMGGLIQAAIARFGETSLTGSLVRFVGAYQDDQTGATRALEVVAMGRYTEIDFGNAKSGDNTTHKYKLACSYYRLIVDGVDWIEIDLINMIFTVMGIDRYADIRAALGR
jgi:P2 family phage contractile tail tube protein